MPIAIPSTLARYRLIGSQPLREDRVVASLIYEAYRIGCQQAQKKCCTTTVKRPPSVPVEADRVVAGN